jgi:Transposase zinc-binding domain/Putative transposase
MIEVADVFRRFAADYLSAHGTSMLPSHRRAIKDILDCRTAALGGQVWHCEACNTEVFSYHSCGNRSCPKCHTAQTQEWLERRRAELLPVPYFHITITVPAELRAVLRANQRDGYGVLMQACAAAIIELARDPRYVGGTVAVLAVLHTWTRQLGLHPHVHCLVSGGGISEDAATWHPARRKFLIPIKALAKLVRGKFRALLLRKRPDLVIPDAVWRTRWILHVTAWGTGEQAVSIGIQKGPPIGVQKGPLSRRCRNDVSASGRCQSRPKPRGGTIAWSSVRSRSQIACNASARALSCRFSGNASSQTAY